jgi:hypothetical protein
MVSRGRSTDLGGVGRVRKTKTSKDRDKVRCGENPWATLVTPTGFCLEGIQHAIDPTVPGGITVHAHPWVIGVQALGSITALQFVYIAVGLTVHLVCFRKLIPHVQMAIGRRLRAELEVPRGVPPELSVLVARLPSA